MPVFVIRGDDHPGLLFRCQQGTICHIIERILAHIDVAFAVINEQIHLQGIDQRPLFICQGNLAVLPVEITVEVILRDIPGDLIE